jgi:hypothetical protein
VTLDFDKTFNKNIHEFAAKIVGLYSLCACHLGIHVYGAAPAAGF